MIEIRITYNLKNGAIHVDGPPDTVLMLGLIEQAKMAIFSKMATKPKQSKILIAQPGALPPQ